MKSAPPNSTHLYPLGTVNGTPETVRRDHFVLKRVWQRIANRNDRERIEISRQINESRSLGLKGTKA